MVDALPLAELLEELDLADRENYRAAFAVLDSMYRDYHDTRASPTMSLDDHLVDCRIGEPQATFVRSSLQPISSVAAS